MAFFYAFCAAGLLLVGLGLLAFRYARTVCLHLLTIWIYFAALPLATAWLYTGHITTRMLIGQDLYSTALADAFTEHAYLFALYGLGVLCVALLFQDSQVFARARRALAQQRFKPAWLALFLAALGTQTGVKLSYGFLLAGSSNEAFRAQLPYSVTSTLSILSTLVFGLFCYLALFSARIRFLTAVCLSYVPYVLMSDGRRAMVSALVTLFVLRQCSLGLKPNRRLAGIAVGALALFILVGPIFVEARSIVEGLQARGVPQTTALVRAPVEALNDLLAGKTSFDRVADNVAERGNAGMFFLAVASRNVPLQHGRITWTSVLWAVPSIFAEKPPLQAEGVIQQAANMRLLDDANSTPATLYVDFGYLGMVFAGAFTALLLYALAGIIAHSGQFTIFSVTVLGTFFWISFHIETEMVGYFVEFRNIALLAPLTILSRFMSAAAHPRYLQRRPRPLPQWAPRAAGRASMPAAARQRNFRRATRS